MKYVLSTIPFVASIASAHSGHNHADWTAPLYHALWLAPTAVTAIAATYFAVKKFKK